MQSTSRNRIEMEATFVSAVCRPILLPLGHLGESIAIAFVGVSDTDTPFASRTIDKILKCLPADIAHACVSYSEIIVKDYLAWCAKGKSSLDWEPPLAGLLLGEQLSVSAYAESELGEMARRLGALYVEKPSDSVEVRSGSVPRANEEKVFLGQVMREVLRSNPELENRFHRDFNLRGKSIGNEIDFCGQHYVTCYAAINPNSRSSRVRVNSASAALWNLARARDAFGFEIPSTIELTAWVPSAGLPMYTDSDYVIVEDTVAELKEQAKREELTVFPVSDSLLAGKRLVERELLSVAIQ
jgi:hypothetical protein